MQLSASLTASVCSPLWHLPPIEGRKFLTEEVQMKNSGIAVALIVALVTSSAALAAPKSYATPTGVYQPGQYFDCLISRGPAGFMEGPCWIVRG